MRDFPGCTDWEIDLIDFLADAGLYNSAEDFAYALRGGDRLSAQVIARNAANSLRHRISPNVPRTLITELMDYSNGKTI